MRKEFAEVVSSYLRDNPHSIFLTGDLGFAALEGVRESGANRFINTGVAEQNMVGVAAGMAYTGSEVFVYSIAPFAVYRCLEQIKIDVCIHRLPVYIVGNGGGYGYGIMGATHHAIEDIACVSSLPEMTCWVPAFSQDVGHCFHRMTELKKPGYLRLGAGMPHAYEGGIHDVNRIIASDTPGITVAVMGPVVQNAIHAVAGRADVDLYTFLSVPVSEIPTSFFESVAKSGRLLVIEEHVRRGGFGEELLSNLVEARSMPAVVRCLYAKGYPSDTYGSQKFHQKESGLDTESIRLAIESLVP